MVLRIRSLPFSLLLPDGCLAGPALPSGAFRWRGTQGFHPRLRLCDALHRRSMARGFQTVRAVLSSAVRESGLAGRSLPRKGDQSVTGTRAAVTQTRPSLDGSPVPVAVQAFSTANAASAVQSPYCGREKKNLIINSMPAFRQAGRLFRLLYSFDWPHLFNKALSYERISFEGIEVLHTSP